MAYIGKQPLIGNFQVCDAISTVNGQAAYTLQVGGANVSPETANNMIVSVNGVIQKPNISYTVSGSTITFTSNLVTGDVIDFIQILGNVLDLGVPSDNTVTTAKIADGAVTGDKLASGTGGKVLQVIHNDFQTRISTTSTSFTEATGLATSITPSSASNKVLIIGAIQMGNAVGTGGNIQIKRDSTIIGKTLFKWWYIPHADSGYTLSYTFLDTPSTTSATSYKLFFRSDNGATVYINSSGNYGGNANEEGSSQITLMEIAG